MYIADRSRAADDTALPPNITVTSIYRTVITRMLQRSATFRQQCARLGRATHLTIDIRLEPIRASDTAAAWTNIRRVAGDRLHAVVTVPHGARPIELIAHELEHILEYLDGVNLAGLSRVESSGVHDCRCLDKAAYETARAIKAGLQVAEEVGERQP